MPPENSPNVTHCIRCLTLAYCLHVGEKPFAGMRHAQIIYYVTTLLAHPEMPKDAPSQLKVLDWSGVPLPILCVLCKISECIFSPLKKRSAA